MKPRVLVVDNYDSFVYILVQYLGELGADPVVVRNDAATLAELEALTTADAASPIRDAIVPGAKRSSTPAVNNSVAIPRSR